MGGFESGGSKGLGGLYGSAGFSGGRVFDPTHVTGSTLLFRGLDPGSASSVQYTNGTARLVDTSRGGTACQMQPGRCYKADGTNDYVTFGTVSFGTAKTFCVWAKTTQTSHRNLTDVDNTSGWICAINQSGSGNMSFFDGPDLSWKNLAAAGVNDGSWHHLAWVVDGTSCEMFLDGVSLGTVTITSASQTNVNVTLFDDSASTWLGEAFDARWFNRALSDTEIATIASMTMASAVIGAIDTVTHYKCDEGGSYTTAVDSSGNGNDGTITAAVIATFQDESANDQYSWQNEIGYSDDTDVSGAYLPRDESDPTKDTSGAALECVGPIPHDPILSSPCGTLDGVADVIDFGDVAAADVGTGNFSYSIWIKTTQASAGMLWSKNVGAGSAAGIYWWHDSGQIKYNDGTTTTTFSASGLDDDEWHHLLLVREGTGAGQLKLYVDGTVDATTSMDSRSLSNANALRIGANATATFFYFAGGVAHAAAWDSALDASDASTLATGGTVSGAFLSVPVVENGSDAVFDVSGNSNHGTLSGTVAPFRANQQNIADTLVTNGGSIGNIFNGTRFRSAATVSTSAAALSVSCWIRRTSGTLQYLVGEYNVTGDKQAWTIGTWSGGELRVIIAADGALANYKDYRSASSIIDGEWHHVGFSWDAGTLILYLDGAAITPTKAVDDVFTSRFVGTAEFQLGDIQPNNSPWTGQVSACALEDAVWSAATFAANTVPASAYYWVDGGVQEVNQGLVDLTVQSGSASVFNIPQGLLPVTIGPGILFPGQSLDLTGGEANSVYAQQVAAELADMTYGQGDDDEADVLFARVDAPGWTDSGDDRILVYLPALTGDDLTNVQAYTA